METEALKNFNAGALRPGQQGAVEKIIQRVVDEQAHTSVVLPTRYGKTDVMRVAGAMLLWNKVVGRCFILEPSATLVKQVMDVQEMDKAVSRYGLPLKPSVLQMNNLFRFNDLVSDRADFTAMTIQMATQNTPVLTQLAKWESGDKGSILVFIDEAHTGSSLNRWGECAEALSKAGAILVLLTATPFRTDKIPIYGFKYNEVATAPVKIYKPNGDPELIDLYEGFKTVMQLEADYEYTFQDAWREDPLPICHINRRAFDVDLTKVQLETGENMGNALLSSLSSVEARRKLGALVRSDVVVRQGAQTFVEELLDFRRKVNPGGKGIVYVGNDRDNDQAQETIANEHALQVQQAIGKCAPSLRVVIATSSMGRGSDEAQRTIDAFREGRGADVLIVKQMGGVGLDIPSLKVCLDLSPVRTGPQFVQRMMRIATVWRPSDDRREDAYIGYYVTPDDILSRGLFEHFVKAQGGEATMTNAEYQATYERQSRPIGHLEYIPITAREGATILDTESLQTPGERLPFIRRVTDKIPRLKRFMTDPQIGSLEDIVREDLHQRENGNMVMDSVDAVATPPSQENLGVQDIGANKKSLRESINQNIRRIVHREHPAASKKEHVELYKKYHTDLKIERCGLPYKQLDAYSLEDLEYLKEESDLWFSEL